MPRRRPQGRIPRGVEILVNRAAVDPRFRRILLEKRAGAAKLMNIRLDPSEAAMLRIVPREQLDGIISRTKVGPGLKEVLLKGAATVTFAALGATASGCKDTDGGGEEGAGAEEFYANTNPVEAVENPPVTDGIRPGVEEYYVSKNPIEPVDEPPVTDGIRPDDPPVEYSMDDDGDLLPDDWEVEHFGDTESEAGYGDADEDDFTNFAEYQAGTDPMDPSSSPDLTYGDADGDELPDDWEIESFGGTDLYAADDDPDGDAARNIEEYYGQTNPLDTLDVPMTATGVGCNADLPGGTGGTGRRLLGLLGGAVAYVLGKLRRRREGGDGDGEQAQG